MSQNQKIKLQVEVSLEDFFDSDSQRSCVFQEALESTLKEKLSDHEWVESNIAHYIFKSAQDEIINGELATLREKFIKKVNDYEPSDYHITSNKEYGDIVDSAIRDLEPNIKEAVSNKLIPWINSDDGDYSSFRGRVADAAVDRVYDIFVEAIVEKEAGK